MAVGNRLARDRWEKREGEDAKLSPPEFIAKHYAAGDGGGNAA